MKKRLGIILPGNIGDIIICLPIAKFYADKGYEIIWPVYDFIINNFINYVDYATFKPVSIYSSIADSFDILNKLNCEILDLSFTSPGSWENKNSKYYLNQTEYTFDEFRYKLANVPLENKWLLTINRNLQREDELFHKLVNNPKYTVYQKYASDQTAGHKLDLSSYTGQIVEILPITSSVFDWLSIIEKADQIVLIESCFANLIDQLSINNKKQILLLKHGYYGAQLSNNRFKGLPILKNNWIRI